MKTVLEIISMSTQFLQGKSIKNARKEAVDLIAHCLKVKPLELYMQFDRPLDEVELEWCRAALRRRSRGEPFQYICGKVDFFNTVICVNGDVLIPRQETEILVDMIVKELSAKPESLEDKSLLDLCCGSGCIGIALKKALPNLNVTMTDISPLALAVAKENAHVNDVSVSFLQGDFLDALQGAKVDFLVCNPPYISEAEFEHLDVEVRGFEPKLALLASEEGLYFYRKLASAIPNVLRPQGKMWLEIGSTQGSAVVDLFSPLHPMKMKLLKDWSGLDRFFFLEME